MYKVKFISDSGDSIVFSAENGIVADFDLSSGVSTDIGFSQSFGQVGETAETKSIKGRPIAVKGTVYGEITKLKKKIGRIFNPFASGILIFEDKYKIRVDVKEMPSFSPLKKDGRFTMLLIAPYPFFKSLDVKTALVGRIKPLFRFPVNYSTPHKFGESEKEKSMVIVNDSDIRVPLNIEFEIRSAAENIRISDIERNKTLKFNGTLNQGDKLKIYRDDRNILHSELTRSGNVTNVINRIDKDSNFYYLEPGANSISIADDGTSKDYSAFVSYSEEVVAVYED